MSLAVGYAVAEPFDSVISRAIPMNFLMVPSSLKMGDAFVCVGAIASYRGCRECDIPSHFVFAAWKLVFP